MNEILNEEGALEAIRQGGLEQFVARLDLFDELSSSNDYLLEREPPRTGFALCVARRQTNGRGRRNRVWVSPPGGVYLSLAHAMPRTPHARGRAGMLGMTLTSKLVSALCALNADVVVKPPNDVVCAAGKLAGVLVETNDAVCVLGVGLNVHRPERDADGFSSAAYLNELLDECPALPSLLAMIVGCGIQSFQETFQETFTE